MPAYDTGVDGHIVASMTWTIPKKGHICVKLDIDHYEDITSDDNWGQENCTVGATASPAEVTFRVWNPSAERGAIFMELRQMKYNEEEEKLDLWETSFIHPGPQWREPGEESIASVILDPENVDIEPGEKVEFILTAFVNGMLAGGANFIITVSNELDNAAFFALNNVWISDRTTVNGSVGSNGNIEIGADAVVYTH